MADNATTLRFPNGLKWDCGQCGMSCRHVQIGPIEPEIIQGLKEKSIEEHWPAAKEQAWVKMQDTANGAQPFFTTIDGHCIFLDTDESCSIHRLFGADAKPGFCREFPFHFVHDPKGLAAIVRPTCARFHETFEHGTDAKHHVIKAFEASRGRPLRGFHPPYIAIYPDCAVTPEQWLALETYAEEDLSPKNLAPTAFVATLRQQIDTITMEERAPANLERFNQARQALYETFRMLFGYLLTQPASPGEKAFLLSMHELFSRAQERQEQRAPALDENARAYLNLVLCSLLMGKLFSSKGSVAAGLGTFLFHVDVCTRAAQNTAASGLSLADFGEKLAHWLRFTENMIIQNILLKAAPACTDLYLHAPENPERHG
jgi:Fe-S-cluster containining protein